MLLDKLEIILDEKDIDYAKVVHPKTYTAQQTAHAAHIPGNSMLKTVIVRIDGVVSMAVLPATERIDLERLKNIAGASKLEITSEDEFRGLFPECEIGAMPPLGNLYHIPVYVDDTVGLSDTVAFNAGTHRTLLQVACRDYLNLVHPVVGRFSNA